MEEISTSFCFICLLHLANEQGLKLESAVDGIQAYEESVQEEGDKRIGDIWDLKVSHFLSLLGISLKLGPDIPGSRCNSISVVDFLESTYLIYSYSYNVSICCNIVWFTKCYVLHPLKFCKKILGKGWMFILYNMLLCMDFC